MKKLAAMMLALLMALASTGIAEEVPFSEWIAGQDPVVTDVFAEDEVAPEAPVPEAPAFEPIGVGSRGETVAQLQAKLIELGILDSKADGIFGAASEAAVKYTQKALGWEETGVIQTADELNTILALVPGDGVNLAVGTSDEWSEWITPEYNAMHRCFTVSKVYPGDKQVGDPYTCQVEVEFSNVTMTEGIEDGGFRFQTQAAVDGEWGDVGASNFWNVHIVQLFAPPADGVYKYVSTGYINETSVNAEQFDVGFRCDNWASGQFRVRCVKVEKGSIATDWSQSPKDMGDGINLAMGTSGDWSEWMTPEYNAMHRCFTVSKVYPGEKQVGDPYTCQVEVEFSNVTMTEGIEDGGFRFQTQGAVDGEWGDVGASNFWNVHIVQLFAPPADGVYKYVSTGYINETSVNAEQFDIGFRCDNWASGQFRVRCIKVEKGMNATDWSPAP